MQEMAASNDDGVLLGGVEWSSSPVTFHRNKGKNVELIITNNTVATRTKDHNYGIVFTSELMVVGQMLKVTVTEEYKYKGHCDRGVQVQHLEWWNGESSFGVVEW